MALRAVEHLLIRHKTGDVRWRHCFLLTDADGTSHRILTPNRVTRDLDSSGADIDKLVAWDGVNLPR